jgi:arylsulfatase A-like enzyme
MTARKKLPRILVPVFVLLAILAASLTLWTTRPPQQPNVLWITMDSLRYDHLSCMGYERPTSPTIDALAAHSALFRQCIAQSNYTNISVPSMVTGIYPALLDVRTPLHDLDDLFITLAEHLDEAGYATAAVVPDWPGGINQGFQRLEVPDSDTDKRTQACLDILSSLDDRPFFIWLYYWDPHAPYLPPEPFAERFGVEPETPPIPEGAAVSAEDLARWRRASENRLGWEMMKTLVKINEGNASPEEGYRQRLIDRYDAEIAYVDDRLGRVLETIKNSGLWDETLVILNADHGEGFGEHGLFFHGYGFYEEEIRVPLIIKPPRSLSSPRMIETTVRNLDIMTTVLDYCRRPIPEELNGRSLRPGIEGHRMDDLPAAMESNTPEKGIHLAGYRSGGYKVIYRLGEPPELYHLLQDPGERVNLLSAQDSGDEGGREGTAGEGAGGTAGEMAAARSGGDDGGGTTGEGAGQAEPVAGPDPDAGRTEQQLRRELLAVYGFDRIEDLLYTYRKRDIDPENLEKLRALGYIY